LSHFSIARAQHKAWSILSRSFRAGRVASTYLFHGREGVGDWSLAVEFAALLNCEQPIGDGDDSSISYPCGECRQCRTIRALNFEGLQFVVPIRSHKNDSEAIDFTNEVLEQKRLEPFKMLDTSSPINIPISLARRVKRSTSIRPAAGVTRVVVFYQMEKMRQSSTDALLKLIEEPPADTVIILTAEKPDALLPTIQSRAQKIRLERLPELAVIEYLQEKYDLTETHAQLLARLSEGVLGRAIDMAQPEDGDESSRRAVGLLLFKSLITEPAPAALSQIFELMDFRDRGAATELVRLWQSLIRDCAMYAQTGAEDDLVNVDFTNEIKHLAVPFANSNAVSAAVTTLKKTLADFPRNVHIAISLLALALKLRSDLAVPGDSIDQEATGG